jgi:Ni,Fe-hydrogenase III large subunit/NADH:ubiquinone oxidoreductase subunit C
MSAGETGSTRARARPAARGRLPAATAEERSWLERRRADAEVRALGQDRWEVEIPPARWHFVLRALAEELRPRLVSYWAERAPPAGLRLWSEWHGRRSAWEARATTHLEAAPGEVGTLLPDVPAATYFEREIHEMYGTTIFGTPDDRPLVHHYRTAPTPGPGAGGGPARGRAPYAFPRIDGNGVHEIRVGPVHAGVIEPGHFRFQVVGEQILDLEIRLGYAHKGTERLFEGRVPELAMPLAESLSGDSSVAGALAFATAVEAATGRRVPERSEVARGFLAELERAAFLLGDVAGIILDTGYPAGAAEANVLRDRTYALLEATTGSRLGRGIVTIGGVRRPLHLDRLAEVTAELMRDLPRRLQALRDHLEEQPSVMDRLRGTGGIPPDLAECLGMVGPAARASDVDRDVRRDRPYGAYAGLEVRVATRTEGDVAARFAVKLEEVAEAWRLARAFAERLGDPVAPAPGPLRTVAGDGLGRGLVEAPRGEWFTAVRLADDGSLARVHVREPSFMGWPALEYAVKEAIVPDFPLCNKSLNFSYSGFDR